MARRRKPSPQATRLLAAMLSRPGEWRHGYDLIKAAGIRSGTLYPLLIRLTEEGVLEAEWQPAARAGLPARHAYRLTPSGIAFARAWAEPADSTRSRLAPA